MGAKALRLVSRAAESGGSAGTEPFAPVRDDPCGDRLELLADPPKALVASSVVKKQRRA
jgi:hypothetical protein